MRTALTGLGDQPEDQKLDRSKRVPLHDPQTELGYVCRQDAGAAIRVELLRRARSGGLEHLFGEAVSAQHSGGSDAAPGRILQAGQDGVEQAGEAASGCDRLPGGAADCSRARVVLQVAMFEPHQLR